VNADYQLAGVGYNEAEIAGYGHFLHNLVLATYSDDLLTQSSSFAIENGGFEPLVDITGYLTTQNIRLVEAGTDEPLYNVTVDLGLKVGASDDGWHLIPGDTISWHGKSFTAHSDYQPDYHQQSDPDVDFDLLNPEPESENGDGTVLDGLLYRYDFYYQG